MKLLLDGLPFVRERFISPSFYDFSCRYRGTSRRSILSLISNVLNIIARKRHPLGSATL